MSEKKDIRPISISTLHKYKQENRKITALTAYDYSTAKCLDEAGIDIVLVGDSLAMVALGYDTTHSVTIEDMLVFTKAVARGVKTSFVIADMPFMSYQTNKSDAVKNAGRFIQEAGAKAIKIEGGSDYIIDLTKHCVEVGIPVLAHLGFTPQFIHTMGGYNIQGKTLESTELIIKQAKKLQEAGAFALVLEMVPEEAAKVITDSLSIPTIGIGAGRYCSGQILVTDDVLGKYTNFTPKFARKYADIADCVTKAVNSYKKDVLNENFPLDKEVFKLKEEERVKLENAFS